MIAAPTAHVITMMPAPSHLPRQARNATTAIVPQGITKRPAPRGRATASAVLRTIPKTTRQPAMPSEYSDASTTGPNPRMVARQGAKNAPAEDCQYCGDDQTVRPLDAGGLAERGREAEQPQEQDPATQNKTGPDHDFLADR